MSSQPSLKAIHFFKKNLVYWCFDNSNISTYDNSKKYNKGIQKSLDQTILQKLKIMSLAL